MSGPHGHDAYAAHKSAPDDAPHPGAMHQGQREAALSAAGVLASRGIVLSPAIGAVLMSASTIIVAINAQSLRRARL